MKVSEIMAREAVSVGPDAKVQTVARIMIERGVTGVPVLDRYGKVLGLVTEADLIVRHANLHLPLYLNILDGFFPFRGERAFQEEVRKALAVTAEELMDKHPVTISVDADVTDAATLMMESGANPVLVVTAGKFEGMLFRADILKLMVLKDEQAEDSSSG